MAASPFPASLPRLLSPLSHLQTPIASPRRLTPSSAPLLALITPPTPSPPPPPPLLRSLSHPMHANPPPLGEIPRPDFPILHQICAKATDAYEEARTKVAYFVNAMGCKEIVFTRNAAEAINLVTYSWGLSNLRPGDEIVLTVAEHHSAIVPWQIVAKKTGTVLKYVRLTKEEVPDLDQFKGLLSKNTKLVVAHHIFNVLGSVLPIDEIMVWSRNVGAKVLVDACQSVPHMVVDVQKLDVDFQVASSHKICGPTGVGFLYGKIKLSFCIPWLNLI